MRTFEFKDGLDDALASGRWPGSDGLVRIAHIFDFAAKNTQAPLHYSHSRYGWELMRMGAGNEIATFSPDGAVLSVLLHGLDRRWHEAQNYSSCPASLPQGCLAVLLLCSSLPSKKSPLVFLYVEVVSLIITEVFVRPPLIPHTFIPDISTCWHVSRRMF